MFQSYIFDIETPHPATSKHLCLLTRLIEYYSELPRLLNVIVRSMLLSKSVLRHRQDLTSKDNKNEFYNEKEAMLALIQHEQHSFSVDNLKQLMPFLDQQGIYRVNGRLSNVDHLSYDERFNIILPKGSNLTKLII